MTAVVAERAMEVDEEVDDPIPNELDNALVHLIPAITACSSDPISTSYLNLDTFETMAGPALRAGAGPHAGDHAGDGTDSTSTSTARRRYLDTRISEEVEVAFRHCMHETGLALVGADADIGGGGSVAAGGGRGGGRTRKGKKEAAGAGTGAAAALQAEEEAMANTMSGPTGILSLALEFASKEAELNESAGDISGALSGLPLLLLEDFLESQGRKACKVFWSKWVEPNAERLTKLVGMRNNANYTLIRLCKKLAQRMSKTDDSSFCGQIHMFLATALGFSERSGLNVTGGINLDNVTAFEDEEQFRRTMMGFEGEETAAASGNGDGSDPMEVESAGADAGGKNKQKKQGSAASGEFAVDYPLYQSFWRLQKYTLQQNKAVRGGEAKETWEALLADVDKILGAFEANAFSEHDLRLARERWAAAGSPAPSTTVTPSPSSSSSSSRGAAAQPGGSGKRKRGGRRGLAAADAEAMGAEARGGVAAAGEGGGGAVYFGLKYLTSSRLLKLQLRDPTLRLQVLTQWLILAASLKSKVTSTKDCPNSVEDLKPRIELAKRLVRATPPRGEEYLGMLQIVLNRETAWTQWKDVKKCKAVEPVAVEEERQAAKDKEAGVVAPAPSFPNKRPRPPAAVAQKERAKHAPLGADFPLEKMVAKLRAGVPSSEGFLEEQRMYMEDPDTPVSEWPSTGPLYTWRALRLLGRENPANLVGCYDGDLVKAMERLDKAKTDAKEAETAAEAAAAAAAAGPAPEQPPKSEAAPSPEAAEVAEVVGKTGEGDTGAMVVDGEEDGEVELKEAPVVAEATQATATDALGGASEDAADGSAKSRDTNGVAGAVAASSSEEARIESEPVVAPIAVAVAVTPAEVETPSPSPPQDAILASTPAPTDAAATSASAAAEPDAAAVAGKPADGDGNGDGDGDGSAAAAAPDTGTTGTTGSLEEAPNSSTTTTDSSTRKPGAVASWLAPVTGTKATAAAKKVAVSPPPSPTRASRRKGKSTQNGGGK